MLWGFGCQTKLELSFKTDQEQYRPTSRVHRRWRRSSTLPDHIAHSRYKNSSPKNNSTKQPRNPRAIRLPSHERSLKNKVHFRRVLYLLAAEMDSYRSNESAMWGNMSMKKAFGIGSAIFYYTIRPPDRMASLAKIRPQDNNHTKP